MAPQYLARNGYCEIIEIWVSLCRQFPVTPFHISWHIDRAAFLGNSSAHQGGQRGASLGGFYCCQRPRPPNTFQKQGLTPPFPRHLIKCFHFDAKRASWQGTQPSTPVISWDLGEKKAWKKQSGFTGAETSQGWALGNRAPHPTAGVCPQPALKPA